LRTSKTLRHLLLPALSRDIELQGCAYCAIAA
jgi:hypothetical protein